MTLPTESGQRALIVEPEGLERAWEPKRSSELLEYEAELEDKEAMSVGNG